MPSVSRPVMHSLVPGVKAQRKPLWPWNLLKLEPTAPQSKTAAATTPHAPAAPCTAKASTGSSTCILRISQEVPTYRKAPTPPMMQAKPHSTLPQDPLTATRPARMPLQKPATSYFRKPTERMRNATRPPVAAPSVVFIATWAAMKPFSMVFIAMVEPQFNPYQPNQRRKVPRTTNGILCGANSLGLSKRPLRAPTAMDPMREPTPPVRWMMPLPAKSVKPMELTSVASRPMPLVHATMTG
mmetsp:Transcript_52001/g.137362  ORF Transcript_52001/g.137362 Transcript_52001/m.137362 type:complete len:241 (+) Transcript_52001:265-987(+)